MQLAFTCMGHLFLIGWMTGKDPLYWTLGILLMICFPGITVLAGKWWNGQADRIGALLAICLQGSYCPVHAGTFCLYLPSL